MTENETTHTLYWYCVSVAVRADDGFMFVNRFMSSDIPLLNSDALLALLQSIEKDFENPSITADKMSILSVSYLGMATKEIFHSSVEHTND